MRILRIKAIAVKELIQIRRDPLSLAMAFLMPVMLLFIFAYAITLDVNQLTTVVYDRDHSSVSRGLIGELGSSGYFTVVRHATEHGDIDAYLDSGKARVAISIPSGFAKDIHAGRTAQLQIIVDGSDSNTAAIALGYIQAFAGSYAQRLSGQKGPPAVDARVRVWYNSELKSRYFIIPGLIAVIMVVIAALLTSLTFAREWERGTMEQLISTPVKTPELVLGKLIPYFLIAFFDVSISVLTATTLFGVPLRGSILLLAVLTSFFLFGGLGLGMVISIVTKAQLVASQIAMVATFLPAFLLSGFMFAISNMPVPLQVLTRIIPARYYVTVVKGIFLKESGLRFLVVEALFLAVFGIFIFIVANKKFKKKIV
jgi:ABC-2 type transport system permease protein